LAQATRKKAAGVPISSHVHRGLREGGLLFFGALALYLLIALYGYDPADPGWSHTADRSHVNNIAGVVGAWFADVFLYLFGLMAYLFPILVGYFGWFLYSSQRSEQGVSGLQIGVRVAGFIMTLLAGAGLATLHVTNPSLVLPLNPGGILGDLVGQSLVTAVSFLGATLFLLTIFLTGITFFTSLSWLWLMDVTGELTLNGLSALRQQFLKLQQYLQGRKAKQERTSTTERIKQKKQTRKPPKIEPVINKPVLSTRVEEEKQVMLFETPENTTLPPLSLLDDPVEATGRFSDASLEAMSQLVEAKLRDFGVEVEVVAINPGPVITRFELQPAAGVKVSRITNLSKDLARALSTISVRVVEVIPGKSVIGLEVPNEERELVRLSEIIRSKDYEASGAKMPLAMGKDIGGHPVVVDLAKMPHLLVAGTTGSGKSVAINAMILSLLYNSTAEDVRLIMIDPKMLELSVYSGIPHLLTPVVTDMKEAANAFRWCVAEMERRYRLMAGLGVRHISTYNKKVREAAEKGEKLFETNFEPQAGSGEYTPPELVHLPNIVVIVDELADMMMMVGKKVEELIARIAQKARAAGIHLILATQRPSVDVITGLIKANIPTRVAFQVSSKVDSRTILDQMGAEQLLGHGDMLYLAPGTGIPNRIHGAFVSDDEVHKVVANLKRRGEPEYLEEITTTSESDSAIPGLPGEESDIDELYDEAVRIVTESRRASISGLQRRLKIGYNRSARMIEEMERTGVVSEVQSNGMREVLAPPPVEA